MLAESYDPKVVMLKSHVMPGGRDDARDQICPLTVQSPVDVCGGRLPMVTVYFVCVTCDA